MPELRLTWLRRGRREAGALPVLRVESLCVNVGIRRVVEDLDFEVWEADAVCVTGPNGSGKSTLLNAIAGLAPARVTAGRILLDGKDVTRAPAHVRASCGLAYVKQRDNVFEDLTVEENLRLAGANFAFVPAGDSEPRKLSRAVDAGDPSRPRRFTGSLSRAVRASLLSGGQKQRLAWAMGTSRQSRLVLADEPEAGVGGIFDVPDGAFLVVTHETERWRV